MNAKNMITETLIRQFINREDDYALQQPDGQYFRANKKLTSDTVEQHLQGEITVATYQLNSENTVKELVLDIDPEHNANPAETAQKLVEASLENKRFPKKSVWLESSRYPDPSFHVRILFAVPIPAKVAKWLGAKLLTVANVNPNTVELFPKQTKIDSNGFGNCIKLPLGFHQVEKKWSRFLDHETWKPLPNEAILEAEGVSFSEKDHQKITQLAEVKPAVQRQLSQKVYRSSKKIRPCIREAAKLDLRKTKENHLMRLGIAVEYLANKTPVEEIKGNFKTQQDYNEKKTTKQIEHAKTKGYKPFTCNKIKTLGFCIGEACPIFRITQRRFEKEVEAL